MSDRCAFLTLLSGAKIRVGAGPEKLDWIYNIKAKYIHTRYHEFHRNVDIVKALGLTPTKILPYVHINNEERKIARDLFIRLELKKERTIGIHPGASRPSKAYPIERYIEVARKLQKEHNLNIFVTWGKGEEELARRLVEETGEKTYLAPSSPTIGTLAALIQQCGLYICNYSGPMNVAMAIETPLVALGATSAEDWGPFGEIHRTINKSGANDQYKSDEERYEVMKKITVDEVYELAVQRMKELYQI
jgi:ADP-heptose:LPS heptosyltransferase